MDLSQFFTEVKRRNTHALAVAYVTAGLLLIDPLTGEIWKRTNR